MRGYRHQIAKRGHQNGPACPALIDHQTNRARFRVGELCYGTPWKHDFFMLSMKRLDVTAWNSANFEEGSFRASRFGSLMR